MNQEKISETVKKQIIINETIDIQKDGTPTMHSRMSNHKNLVLSEMKKAMKDAQLVSKSTQRTSPEKPTSMKSYDSNSLTSSSSSIKKHCNRSPNKSLPKNKIANDDKYFLPY